MNDDSFVVIQSWLNIAEGVMALIALTLCLSACKTKRIVGALGVLIVNVMVFWKTVIFVWYDHNFLSENAKNFTPESILCYYFPSSLWLIFPLISIYLISKRFVKAINNLSKSEPIKDKAKAA